MLQPLASGRTAEIFEWAPGVVLKLYRWDMSRRTVENEIAAQRHAFECGVATPQVFEFVEMESRFGFTMERVDGPNGMDVLFGGADVEQQANELIKLQGAVLELPGGRLPSLKERQQKRILETPDLSDALKERLCQILKVLPDGDRLLHGDFHPGNIIHSDGGLVIVDWIDCSSGPPEADIARSLILFGYCGCNEPSELRTRYTNRYLQKMGGIDRPFLKQWLLVQAGARICEGTEDSPQILEFLHSNEL